MGRIIQPKGTKGSLKWIQDIVNSNPAVLDDKINKTANFKKGIVIEWLSPRAEDEYAEYKDQAFLDLLEISPLKVVLKDFWPSRGPQWDGLGKI